MVLGSCCSQAGPCGVGGEAAAAAVVLGYRCGAWVTGSSSNWLYNYIADLLGKVLSYLPISMDVTVGTSKTLDKLWV